jgi:hypothetical protein
MNRRSIALIALVLAACGGSSGSPQRSPTPIPAAYPAPWQRTESREPCASFDPLRQPFFGDLHVHTKFSADASIYGTKVGPRDAYAFAQGGTIAVADADEAPTRMAQLDRPLDFTAVTDHAEWFGEVDVCLTPGSSAYDLKICQLLRRAEAPSDQFLVTVQWLYPAGIAGTPPPSLPFCDTPGVDCDAAAVSVWQEMQAAAEEAYDRTSACRFTSFIGYENTASPGGRHLHRNVIFRNEHVPPRPASHLETAAGGFPQGLWTAIEQECLNADIGCDAVIIPHNSNLSGGQQFVDPSDGADAQRRQDREPLVEIHQQKGNSECRFDRLAGAGVGTADELCTFEQLPEAAQGGGGAPPIDQYPRRNLVRETLKDGLAFEQTLGANPFKFGFVGSTDTHNATAGNVDEWGWVGSQGNNDATPERMIGDNARNNPGGLTAVWAEENSRDAIFAALRRRETYATSGTRPIVRLFAGDLSGVSCDEADFVAHAYQHGTAMGGDLGALPGAAAPRLAVLAARDPGTADVPGTPLQRVQIIKGWVDGSGATHEAVFDVAGDPAGNAGVDPATCAPQGHGYDQLCAVWTDPTFDSAQRAFYYARVLENPTCRWSTRVCKANGVDPFAADCAAQAAAAGDAFAPCCMRESDDAFFSPLVQERAWTSPIWYRPDAIATVDGGFRFGPQRGGDRLALAMRLGAVPAGLDLARDGLVVDVDDGDEILRAEFPPGALQATADGGYEATPGARLPRDVASIRVTRDDDGGIAIALESGRADFAAADRVDHPIQIQLASGTYRSTYVRTWTFAADALGPARE